MVFVVLALYMSTSGICNLHQITENTRVDSEVIVLCILCLVSSVTSVLLAGSRATKSHSAKDSITPINTTTAHASCPC